jgi:hypothetical protein
MASGRVEHVQYLREGELRVNEIEPGLWVVRWRPHRRDHPDYPEITTDSRKESMPTDGGADAVLAWAVERFETDDERIVAEVMLEEEARDGEVEAIEALFDEEGVRSVVTARIARRSAGPLPWEVLIVAPAGVFFTTLAARAAGDAYEPLKRLVLRVFELRRRPDRPDGSVQLEENGRTVILTDKIPDEGLRQLTAGKLPGTGYFVGRERRGLAALLKGPASRRLYCGVVADHREVSGALHVLDALGEQVERTLRRVCKTHEQLIHLVDWRCNSGTTRRLRLRVGREGFHLASKDLVDVVPE